MDLSSDALMHIETVEDAFEHVKNEMVALRHVFVQDRFSIGQLVSDNAKYFHSVRDSIIYRSNSLKCHASQLNSINTNLELQLHSRSLAGMCTALLLPSNYGLGGQPRGMEQVLRCWVTKYCEK
jgi:hypothetical protein